MADNVLELLEAVEAECAARLQQATPKELPNEAKQKYGHHRDQSMRFMSL